MMIKELCAAGGTIPHWSLEQSKKLGHRSPGSTYTMLRPNGKRWYGTVYWNHGLVIRWRNAEGKVMDSTLI